MGNKIITQSEVTYDSGVSVQTLRLNGRGWGCAWCSEDDSRPAPFIIDDGGWECGACVTHVLKFFPQLWPAGKRPAQYGRDFCLKFITARGSAADASDWEYYDRSDTMMNASRLHEGWRMVSRTTNAHYRRTGHFRATYENASGVRITVHAVVR